ncbi:MAG: DUF4115 domain-containing protein [Ignavibacteriales bacterium]|nr:DUF4115 domain-containing protein [Ignavibacteriales bacterium]
MTFESFAAELKKARVEKQISLMDISASTRINLKFLEAIEEGNFTVLPQAYVRAFIREFADAVGYDPKEAMKKYETLRRPKAAERAMEPLSPAVSPQASAKDSRQVAALVAFFRKNTVFTVIVVLAAAFVVYLVRPTSDAGVVSNIAETPFDKVIQENEAALPRKEDPVPLPAVTRPAAVDSLTLEMTTNDSVWMTVTLDGTRTLEYLFPPNRKGSWKAKETFILTMGNAGGATFKLNGHELGTLGNRGAVIRNILISESALPKP